MTAIAAVLLDVGGVFHLPAHDCILAAYERAEVTVDPTLLDRAHYSSTRAFAVDYDGELPWREMWQAYLDRYVEACAVPEGARADAIEHLEAEFAVGALWSRTVPGSIDALRILADTGVKLAIVSNADGSVATRLREQEILQVGPGPGVAVGCVIDSGEVGVLKPDPRIFKLALDALDIEPSHAVFVGDMPGIDVVGARRANIEPIIMDPYGFHESLDVMRVTSLRDVALAIRRRTAGTSGGTA